MVYVPADAGRRCRTSQSGAAGTSKWHTSEPLYSAPAASTNMFRNSVSNDRTGARRASYRRSRNSGIVYTRVRNTNGSRNTHKITRTTIANHS